MPMDQLRGTRSRQRGAGRGRPLLFGLAMAMLCGCGNNYGSLQDHPLNPYGTTAIFNPASLYSSQQGSFQCPLSPNILPTGGANGVGGPDSYTACQDPQVPADLLLHGQTTVSSIVCAFPAEQVDVSHIYTQPDPSTGEPWYQCVDLSQLQDPSQGAQFEFDGVTFNAVFVVEGPDAATMQLCLSSGAAADCPPYSYGKFR